MADLQTEKLIEQGFANLEDRIQEVRIDVNGLRNDIKVIPVHTERLDAINRRFDKCTPHKPENCPNRSSISWLWGVLTLVIIPLVAFIGYALVT